MPVNAELRERLPRLAPYGYIDEDKGFLISFKSRQPDWSLLTEQKAKELPAVQWKIFNIGKMADDKHQAALNNLKDVLESFE